jgi:hypothetical protein
MGLQEAILTACDNLVNLSSFEKSNNLDLSFVGVNFPEKETDTSKLRLG